MNWHLAFFLKIMNFWFHYRLHDTHATFVNGLFNIQHDFFLDWHYLWLWYTTVLFLSKLKISFLQLRWINFILLYIMQKIQSLNGLKRFKRKFLRINVRYCKYIIIIYWLSLLTVDSYRNIEFLFLLFALLKSGFLSNVNLSFCGNNFLRI